MFIGVASYVLVGQKKTTQYKPENTQTKVVEKPDVIGDEEKIKKLLDTKYNYDPETTILTISVNEGNYAKGGYGMSDPQGGGGLWFAAKVDGIWKIVYDGNGIITCDKLENYSDYPVEWIPSCWDEQNQVMVDR